MAPLLGLPSQLSWTMWAQRSLTLSGKVQCPGEQCKCIVGNQSCTFKVIGAVTGEKCFWDNGDDLLADMEIHLLSEPPRGI